jgi:hypothetical protein
MMPAKNKQRPALPDVQGTFAAHIEASRIAHEWAAKCLAYRESGKRAHAKAAEKKARHWLLKAMVLEARAARGKPLGGRRAED